MKDYNDESNKSCFGECISCGRFKIQPENIWFNEQGYGYSTRLTKCPHCERIIVLGHIEDYGFSKLNTDERLYYK